MNIKELYVVADDKLLYIRNDLPKVVVVIAIFPGTGMKTRRVYGKLI